MEFVSGNILIRPNGFMKAGETIVGHTHNFDHTSIVIYGELHVVVKDIEGRIVIQGDFIAGEHFLVKAQYLHEMTSKVDGTHFICIYSHRTPQGDVIQQYNGWGENYV